MSRRLMASSSVAGKSSALHTAQNMSGSSNDTTILFKKLKRPMGI
ncbi:hypothetical protein [uncultured Muribaculum sp.]|nr:hypothetical protein [uncultured Muribaculum sp.]